MAQDTLSPALATFKDAHDGRVAEADAFRARQDAERLKDEDAKRKERQHEEYLLAPIEDLAREQGLDDVLAVLRNNGYSTTKTLTLQKEYEPTLNDWVRYLGTRNLAFSKVSKETPTLSVFLKRETYIGSYSVLDGARLIISQPKKGKFEYRLQFQHSMQPFKTFPDMIRALAVYASPGGTPLDFSTAQTMDTHP
jgi:hypothetical protein